MGRTTSKQDLINTARAEKEKLETQVIEKQAEYASLAFGNSRRIELVREINYLKAKVAFQLGVINRVRAGKPYLGEADTARHLEEATTNRKYN